MADVQASVPKITITQGRIDAQVIFGATRYGVSIDPRNPDHEAVAKALNTLREALVAAVKIDLASRLDLELSPNVRSALKA